jgi:hypothetical protein
MQVRICGVAQVHPAKPEGGELRVPRNLFIRGKSRVSDRVCVFVDGENFRFSIIVSGDQDYVPAVQALKDCGKTVINATFRTRDGKLLPGGALRLNQATDRNLEIPYNKLKTSLKL